MKIGYWPLVALLLLGSILPGFARNAPTPRAQQITIIHTSDCHGEMLPLNRISWVLGERQQPAGGFARHATLIKQLRRETQNPLVTVDCGDLYQHGPWFMNHLGHPEIAAMNTLGYDLFCVGNHDLEYYPNLYELPNLLSLVKESHFPWLSTNLLKSDGTRLAAIRPFVVKKMGALRVGFLGLTDTTSEHLIHEYLPGLKMQDPVEAAKYWVPIARKQCDVLIALTHLGDWESPELDYDSKLVAAVPGIDAVVGGHSHVYTEAPVWYKNPAGEGVPVVYPGEYSLAVGKLDLSFQATGKAWKLAKAHYDLIPVGNTIAEDPEVKAVLDSQAIRRASVRSYGAMELKQKPALDCDPGKWGKVPAMEIGQTPPLELFLPYWKGPQDLSASTWAGWDEASLYLTFDITDDVFFQEQTEAKRIWFNDSIQLDIDPKFSRTPGALDADGREYYLGLMGQKAVVYCSQGPNWGERSDIPAAARRRSDGKGWIFEIALPWKELGITPSANQQLGLAWLIYESDDAKMSGWMQWTDAVTWNGVDPANFGVLSLTSQSYFPAELEKYLE
jgi:5'-nucleotidase